MNETITSLKLKDKHFKFRMPNENKIFNPFSAGRIFDFTKVQQDAGR